ncbi:MAG: hypothetical protein Q9177_002123 [Variospora cf. flavescens]
MFLKLPALLAVASAAISCLAAPPFDGSGLAARSDFAAAEDTDRIPSGPKNGPPAIVDNVVGLGGCTSASPTACSNNVVERIVTNLVIANRASEICGCAPGKVGYFLHGHCTCSGDPLEPLYGSGEDTFLDVEGSAAAEVDPAPIENNKQELQARKLYPICPDDCRRYMRSVRKKDGTCTCVPVNTDWHREKRAKGFTMEEGQAFVNNDALFKGYHFFYPGPAKIKCVVYKECGKPEIPNPTEDFRGTVTPEGYCVCAPSTSMGGERSLMSRLTLEAGRDLASKHGASSELNLQTRSLNIGSRLDNRPLPEGCVELRCKTHLYKVIKVDWTGCECVYDGQETESNVNQHHEPETMSLDARDPKKHENQDTCSTLACQDGHHGAKNHDTGICECVASMHKERLEPQTQTLDTSVRDSLHKREGKYSKKTKACKIKMKGQCLRNQHPEYHLAAKVCWCVQNGYRKRQELDECPNFSCPSGWIPKLNGSVCYCGLDGDFPYPPGPASRGPYGAYPSGDEENSPSLIDPDGDADEK